MSHWKFQNHWKKLKTAHLAKTSSQSLELCELISNFRTFYSNCGHFSAQAYHRAKQSFHTAKPERLVGRETEMETINSFVSGHMTRRTAGSLYISGAPGTGKTATLSHILDSIKVKHKIIFSSKVKFGPSILDSVNGRTGKLYLHVYLQDDRGGEIKYFKYIDNI